MSRVNPDEIEFKYKDGKVEYREAAYITDEKDFQQVRSEVEGGIAMLWENAFQNDSIQMLESKVVEEDDKVWAVSVFNQDSVEAMAALMSELAGAVLDQNQELFARKMLPMMERIDANSLK